MIDVKEVKFVEHKMSNKMVENVNIIIKIS